MTLYSENIIMEKPTIEIEYCTKCKWLNRASWVSQELLSTFNEDIFGIILIPSKIAGIFEIRISNNVIWDRNDNKGTPDIKELKQTIRNLIVPNKDLGHLDK